MKIRSEELVMGNKWKIFFALLCVIVCGNIYAQEFGFNDDSDDIGFGGNSANVTAKVSGEVSAELLGYVHDFPDGLDNINLGDIFSGKLNFSAGTSFADGVINLKIQPTEQPVSIDEAYVRAYFGALEIEGGLRKLTWGKADSFGPLDVINPLDYSELTDLSNTMNLKIARPLIHASVRIGSFSKIEGVFVPTFEPLRYAPKDDRWFPNQIKKLNNLPAQVEAQMQERVQPLLPLLGMLGIDYEFTSTEDKPDTDDFLKLKYAQAGLRFTTTIGPADIGLQYYYGRLTRPAVTGVLTSSLPPQIPIPTKLELYYDYNTYHQIGIDWAQVLVGFNVRAEVAANITKDLSGEDGSIYNPAVLWSFGFDRDLFLGLNLNLQCNQSIRLMYDKIGKNPLVIDTEADTDKTTTQIIAALSRKFFRDELELRFAALWGIEEKDYLLMPAIILTKDAVSVEFSGGIFGGNEDGQFGQYHDNKFVKVSLTYSF